MHPNLDGKCCTDGLWKSPNQPSQDLFRHELRLSCDGCGYEIHSRHPLGAVFYKQLQAKWKIASMHGMIDQLDGGIVGSKNVCQECVIQRMCADDDDQGYTEIKRRNVP